ncbi:hypothetical protein [Rhizobium pisi]
MTEGRRCRGSHWIGAAISERVRTVHGRHPAACRCVLNGAGDFLEEGRAKAAERNGGFEIESLVEFDAVILVENDPARKIETGAPAFDLADRQKQALVLRRSRGYSEQEDNNLHGRNAHDNTHGRALRPVSSPASA